MKRKQLYFTPTSDVVELKMGSVLCQSGGDGSLYDPSDYEKQYVNPFAN